MHSFFINLDRRTDRRKEFEGECMKMEIKSERFSAVSHTVPALGCSLSHIAVLKLARDRGYDCVCIFEDDFEFLVSKEDYHQLIASLPENFDVVMLGYYIVSSQPHDDVFGKVIAATTTSCYIVNQRFYNTLIRNLEEAVSLFQANMHEYDVVSKYINDQYWRRIQPASNWFYAIKRVGRQRASFSDLVGAHVAYDY
jgi:glycosyl transferase family 25